MSLSYTLYILKGEGKTPRQEETPPRNSTEMQEVKKTTGSPANKGRGICGRGSKFGYRVGLFPISRRARHRPSRRRAGDTHQTHHKPQIEPIRKKTGKRSGAVISLNMEGIKRRGKHKKKPVKE